MSKELSEGAVRAAKEIGKLHFDSMGTINISILLESGIDKKLAEIIDQETAAPELLEACKKQHEFINHTMIKEADKHMHMKARLEALTYGMVAIAKAEGGRMRCDQCAFWKRHNLLKIETMGDCYLLPPVLVTAWKWHRPETKNNDMACGGFKEIPKKSYLSPRPNLPR